MHDKLGMNTYICLTSSFLMEEMAPKMSPEGVAKQLSLSVSHNSFLYLRTLSYIDQI